MAVEIIISINELMEKSALPKLFSQGLLLGVDEEKEIVDGSVPQTDLIRHLDLFEPGDCYREHILKQLLWPIRNFIAKYWFDETHISPIINIQTASENDSDRIFIKTFYEKRHTLRKICVVAVALEKYNYMRLTGGKIPTLDDMPQALANFSAFLHQMEREWPGIRVVMRRKHLTTCELAGPFAKEFVKTSLKTPL
jgi:hypothetical protein